MSIHTDVCSQKILFCFWYIISLSFALGSGFIPARRTGAMPVSSMMTRWHFFTLQICTALGGRRADLSLGPHHWMSQVHFPLLPYFCWFNTWFVMSMFMHFWLPWCWLNFLWQPITWLCCLFFCFFAPPPWLSWRRLDFLFLVAYCTVFFRFVHCTPSRHHVARSCRGVVVPRFL